MKATFVLGVDTLEKPHSAKQGTEKTGGRRARGAANARSATAHFNRGEQFRRKGLMRSAAQAYRKAVEYAPDNAHYRFRLSECYASIGLTEEAIGELERARDLKPEESYYHFSLGNLYVRAGRIEEAIASLQKATHFAPRDAYYNVRLGVLCLRFRYLHEAADALRRAIKLDPDNASYHALLGDVYAGLGYDREALRHYRNAGRLDPYDARYVEQVRRMVADDMTCRRKKRCWTQPASMRLNANFWRLPGECFAPLIRVMPKPMRLSPPQNSLVLRTFVPTALMAWSFTSILFASWGEVQNARRSALIYSPLVCKSTVIVAS